jgi:aerobic-type carbon monoxide dehydrogenase small subunit (CoxS/CutS family)
MIMQSVGLLRRDPSPSAAEIRGELEGNICRCGTQNRIVTAVQKAAHTMGAMAKGDRHA